MLDFIRHWNWGETPGTEVHSIALGPGKLLVLYYPDKYPKRAVDSLRVFAKNFHKRYNTDMLVLPRGVKIETIDRSVLKDAGYECLGEDKVAVASEPTRRPRIRELTIDGIEYEYLDGCREWHRKDGHTCKAADAVRIAEGIRAEYIKAERHDPPTNPIFRDEEEEDEGAGE